MNAKADGTWGYSNPNDEHMIFCVDPEYYTMFRAQFASLIVAEGTGMWEGEVEPCFAMSYADFNNIWRNHRYLFSAQKAFLYLGYLQARNWRRARIMSNTIPTHSAFIGTWVETTETIAKQQAGWTHVNNRWYSVFKNPADSLEEEKQRELTQAIFDLRAMLLYVANRPVTYGEDGYEPLDYPKGYVSLCVRTHKVLLGRTLVDGTVLENVPILSRAIGSALVAFEEDAEETPQPDKDLLKPQRQANRGWT